MNIRVYTSEVVMLGSIDAQSKVSLTRRLYRPGVFEILLHPDAKSADKLTPDNIVLFDRDPLRCGVVLYVEDTTDSGGKMRRVRGYTLEGILSRRLTVPPSVAVQYYEGWDRVRGPAETVMKHYVKTQFTEPEYPEKIFPRLRIAPDLARGVVVPWQSRFEPVSLVMEKLYDYTRFGYSIALDLENREFVFDVIEGRDYTHSDTGNPRVVFAEERRNISAVTYIADYLDCANVGYAGGAGSDEDRFIYPIGDATGFGRREVFLDCGGAEIDELIATGTAKLAEKGPKISLEADVLKRPGGVDFGLGDFVTVMGSGGIRLDTQITEITEVWEASAFTASYVFGNRAPTINEQFFKPEEVR